MFLYIIHLTRGFFIIIVAETGDRGHVVIVFTLGSCFVRGVLARILLDVFCEDGQRQIAAKGKGAE